MTTNLARLKKPGAKGAPPAPGDSADPTAADARPEAQPLRPLQVRIPADVFEAFSETAGREFGFSHGAKKRLFLKMWEAYKAQSR